MSHRQTISLRAYRKRSGFTQAELGFLLGAKEHWTVSRYEAGERSPDLKTAFAYALLFDREMGELFGALRSRVLSELSKRARTLAEDMRGMPEDRKTAYKLKQLAALAERGVDDAPDV